MCVCVCVCVYLRKYEDDSMYFLMPKDKKKKIQCIFSSKKDKKNLKFERGVLIGLILESMG